MTSTMLGELSRLFQAEGRKASSPSSQIRLNAISDEIRQRQMAGALPGVMNPYALGQQLGTAIQSTPTPTTPDPTAGLQGALANIANQVNEQGAQASGSAQQAGNQAQTAASNVNTMLLAVAVGIGLVIIFTRR